MTDTVTGAPARNYVGGDWHESASGETYEKRSPWRPSVVTGTYPASDAEDARAAVAAAKDAFPAWSALPAGQRAAFFTKAAAALEARAEQVAQDMTAEMGKPLREARLETLRGAQILRFAAGEAWRPIGEMYAPSVPDQRLYTLRRPLGVVGLITPWNFPIAIPVWKLAPALIHGNTVVLKLGYEAPRTGLHVAECFAEAGLPPGVLNVLTGSGSKAGAEIVSNRDVRAISFTGSVPVGRAVRDEATARDCRVQLELGGHNPLIVTAAAELDRAVEAAYAGAFWSAGQKCTATRRILVEDAVYDAFRDKLLARVAAGRVGDPADPEVEVGPVVNEGALEEILAAVERAKGDGGAVLAGGERADDEGYLIAPTVFEGLADDAELSCEEVFGPVTSLYRYGSLDEAIERANAVRFGLSAAIFTRDLRETQRFTDAIQAGIVHVNSQTAGADVHVPFGGLKGSAWGPHEQGRAAIEFYTETVTVYQDAPLA
ncbi:MAG TPA: aldehyde dehydrogenase family protein [Gaiellaceae bacterium]|jgi:acyl-CoA reductase-like NAD-dependent aldehyde dehydrogenase|nr:aldehyde dehydrogenase family protein [Gaiellaceae bacterium]